MYAIPSIANSSNLEYIDKVNSIYFCDTQRFTLELLVCLRAPMVPQRQTKVGIVFLQRERSAREAD